MKNFISKRLVLMSFLIFANIGFLSLYSMNLNEAYSILGVNSTTPFDEVKKQYKQLSKKWHPDLNSNKANAKEMMQKINEAYETIQKGSKKELNPIAKQFENFSEDIKSEDVTPKDALDMLHTEITSLLLSKNLVELLESSDDYNVFINVITDVGVKYAHTSNSEINDYLNFIKNYIVNNSRWWFLDVIDSKITKFKSDKLTELQNRITQDVLVKITRDLTPDQEKINFYNALKKHIIFKTLPTRWKIIAEKRLPSHDLTDLINFLKLEIENMAKGKNDCKDLDNYLETIATLLNWNVLFNELPKNSKELLFNTLEEKLKSYKTVCESDSYLIYYDTKNILKNIFELLKTYDSNNRFKPYEQFYEFYFSNSIWGGESNESIAKNIVRINLDISNSAMKQLVKDWIEDRFQKNISEINLDEIIKEVEKAQKQKNAIIDNFAQALASIAK